jgi:cold shock CspA family protein
MSSTESVSNASEVQGTKFVGRVKWFDTRKGFGFVTVTDSERSGEDIFVHHSGLNTSEKQYAYLVQGEYIAFETRPMDSDEHKEQAVNVQGVSGGQLMCETRRQQRIERAVHRREQRQTQGDGETREWKQTRRGGKGSRSAVRGRGGGRGRGHGRGARSQRGRGRE